MKENLKNVYKKTNILIRIEPSDDDYDYTSVLRYSGYFDTDVGEHKMKIIGEDFYDPDIILSERARIKTVSKFFKSLFCKHQYIPMANAHGDIIDNVNYKMTYVICAKCGRGRWLYKDIPAPYGVSLVGFHKKEYEQ